MTELISPASALPALPYAGLVVPLLVAQQGERAAKGHGKDSTDRAKTRT